jgi:hypothetical protein
MAERKRRLSRSNSLLLEIIKRLRDYDPDEVVVICNKYLARRNRPPLAPDLVEKTLRRHK